MSEYDDTTVDDDPNPVREQREHIKDLESQLENASRQLAVSRAVPSLSDKQVSMLVAAHDGEWTPEAIQETAKEAFGVAEAPAAEPEPEPQAPAPADLAAATASAEATAGAPPATPSTPGDDAIKAFRDRLYNAPGGSDPQYLAQLQQEFDKVLAEAGGFYQSVGAGSLNFEPISSGGPEGTPAFS